MADTIFMALGTIAVLSAIFCISQRNALTAAIWLVVTMLSLAGMYLILGAPFIAAIQVLVYAGGIMVLFLFVIMLVNIKGLAPKEIYLSGIAPLAVVGGVLLGVLIAFGLVFGVLVSGHGDGTALRSVNGVEIGNTEAIGAVLYTKYLVPFEVVSVVLLVAMIGAIVFGRRSAGLETGGGGREP